MNCWTLACSFESCGCAPVSPSPLLWPLGSNDAEEPAPLGWLAEVEGIVPGHLAVLLLKSWKLWKKAPSCEAVPFNSTKPWPKTEERLRGERVGFSLRTTSFELS